MSRNDDEIRYSRGQNRDDGARGEGRSEQEYTEDRDSFFGTDVSDPEHDYDEESDGSDYTLGADIPDLDGLERERIGSDRDYETGVGGFGDSFPNGFFEEGREDGFTDGYAYDPRDDEESSIPAPDVSEDAALHGQTYRTEPRKKRHTFSFGFIVGMTAAIVFLALAVSVSMFLGYDFGFGVQPPAVSGTASGSGTKTTDEMNIGAQTSEVTNEGTDLTTEGTAETQKEPIDEGSVSVKSGSASEGALILVNKTHEYTFPDIATESLYSFKNDSYKISSSTIKLEQTAATALGEMAAAFEEASGKNDLLIASGIRSYDEQLDLYSARVEKYGIENAKRYVAEPGHSEHHTGLAFDMSVYTDEGVGMLLSDDPEYNWITEHCYEYGFILRYDDRKANITGISEEDWHFRYVGRAHAYYMSANDLCLEEYIELVESNYTYENRLGFNEPTGTRYEVYFVPVSDEENTEIPLPAEKGITTDISGTNSGGFIVTVTYN